MAMNRSPFSLILMVSAFALALGHQLIPHHHDGDNHHFWAHQHPKFLHFGYEGDRHTQDDGDETGTFVIFISIFLQNKTVSADNTIFPAEVPDLETPCFALICGRSIAENIFRQNKIGSDLTRTRSLLPNSVPHALPLGLRAPPFTSAHRG